MIGRGPRERFIAIPRFDINNALQGRKERNSKGVWEGAESESSLFQLIKRGPFLGRTRTARCSIPLDSGKSWLNCALKRAIFSILAQRNGRRRPGYRNCHIYLIVSLGLSTNLSI